MSSLVNGNIMLLRYSVTEVSLFEMAVRGKRTPRDNNTMVNNLLANFICFF
jgi:hypothetical protein